MSIELKEISGLIKNKKYKKALLKLKKMPSNLQDVELYKGVCHSALNQYPQALIAFKAAKKTIPENKKATLLNDMAMAALLMKDSEEALLYYTESLQCDPTANNAFAREQLVALLVNTKQYDLALEYIPKLFVLQKYSSKAFVTGIKAAAASENSEVLQQYLTKVQLLLTDFTSIQLAEILNTLIKHKLQDEFNVLLVELNKSFKDSAWLESFNSYAGNVIKAPKPKIEKPVKKLVTGNDKKLIELINELVEYNKEQGAYFNPHLEIKANNGELSVYYYGEDNKKLIDIPVSCLPLLCDYEFALSENNKLIVKTDINSMVNPSAEHTMQLLVAIYNQCDKMQKWQDSCPIVALYDSPKLLSTLLEAKQYNAKVQLFKQIIDSGNKKKLCIDTFFGSRVFGYKSDFLKKNNVTTINNAEQGLLSVIDFLNHKIDSNVYRLSDNSIYIAGSADDTSKEVFVHYNEFDPIYTYLFYGFVDLSSPFLSSIPCELKTSYGHVWQVVGESTTASKLKEGSFSHKQSYLPEVTSLGGNSIKLNKLIVPSNAKSTLLKDTLLSVINTTAPDEISKSDAFFESEIAQLEKQIILANKAYWLKLQKLVINEKNISSDVLKQLSDLINFAMDSLNRYANKNALVLF